MSHAIYFVDVFAKEAYSGNPLAVVVGDQTLPEEAMQRIAADINFSETTFVNTAPEANGGYRVRIYTPAREIAFAGHPLLGTAQIIRDYIIANSCQQVQLNLSKADISVTFESSENNAEIAWFQAPKISLGASSTDYEFFAEALGIAVQDISTKAPIQIVSAGTSAVILPLTSLHALQSVRVNSETLTMLSEKNYPNLIYLFTEQTHDPQNDLCARFFFEAHGVREDPATGNGAAFLGAYLLQHQFFSAAGFSLRIEQGHQLQRPSLIFLRAHKQNGNYQIEIGGNVITNIEGTLLH